ncbi:MAG: hypothetical protein ACTHN8_11385 [Angustibacter sp.]
MTELTTTARPTGSATTSADHATESPAVWRWAGGLALAHVVLLFAGFSQEVVVAHGDSAAHVQRVYGGANLTRVFTGGYVEAMAFVVLVPALVLLARLFGRRTETGRVASQSFLALGLAYVASTLAIGFAPAAAAIYAAHHGVATETIATVNDLRNYSYVLQVALALAMTLALGVAALAERIHVRWVGWLGVGLGAVGVVATPLAHNAIGMAQLVWWVGLAVLCLRGTPRGSASA